MLITIISSVYISSVMSIAFFRSEFSKKSVWDEVKTAKHFVDKKTFGKKKIETLNGSVITKRIYK